MLKENYMHSKAGKMAQHERGESKKMKLVEKMAEAKAKKRGMR
jgi:hypothetical protein